jgi:uncharacterized integral membrane protein
MYSALIALLLLLFFVVAFSLQNSGPIIITFFAWTFEGSKVVVLLTAMVFGVILSVLASLPSHVKRSRLISQQQKTIANLERSVAELKLPDTKSQSS